MNPKKLILGAAAGIVFSAVATNVLAQSFQQEAWDWGALRFTLGDAELTANYACGAEACVLPALETTDETEIVAISTLDDVYGHTFPVGFFDATDYLGAVDPDATTAWWEGWTLSDGPGSLEAGFVHPLADDLTGGTLLPDLGVTTNADCEAKFFDDGTPQVAGAVTIAPVMQSANGVSFPVCIVDTSVMPTLLEDATFTSDVLWLITGGPNLQIGTGDVVGINTNADGCDGVSGAITSATITMDAGAQIFGDATSTPRLNGIEVTRGSQIMANGTAALPVVLSSADGGGITWPGNDFTDTEEFAGVILDGCAVDSRNPGGDQASEAVQAGETRFYGGLETEDSSGSMTYVVIAESGAEFQPDEEVQGLTLEGVGSGTTLEYIQIHYSGDDGIEWFGGTVNQKYLVVSVKRDDGLDMDAGFQGFIQYALVLNSPTLGDRGIESDNRSDSNPDNLPRTMPTVSNVTLLGTDGNPAEPGESNESTGHMMRQGMGGFFDKMVVADQGAADPMRWQDGCIDLDTMTPSGAMGPALAVTSGALKYRNALFDCDAGPGPATGPGAGITAFKDDSDTGANPLFNENFVVSSIAPLSRFVDATGSNFATYFFNIAQITGSPGVGCLTKPLNALDAFYSYQEIDGGGMLVGTINTPVDVASGVFQGYLITFDPTSAFSPINVEMQAYCENTGQGPSIAALNQPVLGANAGPSADPVVVLTATSLAIPVGGANILASGTVNAGAVGGTFTVDATPLAAIAGDVTCQVCEQDPVTGACLAPFAASVVANYPAGGVTKPFAIACFDVSGGLANDPANHRVTFNLVEAGTLKGQGSFDVQVP